MVVTTLVTPGARGVEENPNRHGGSTGASRPRSAPSNVPLSEVTALRSVAPYHSRRPDLAWPRVLTPCRATRATGSTKPAHRVLRATGPGTARSAQPRGSRPPADRCRLEKAKSG